MKKFPPKADSRAHIKHAKLKADIPTVLSLRDQILAYLDINPGPVNLHHLTRVLKLHGGERHKAKRIVKELAEEGGIRKDGKTLTHVKHQEILIHAKVLKPHPEGGFWAESVAREGLKGVKEQIHLLPQHPRERRGESIRVGYEVLAKLKPAPSGKSGSLQAKILKITSKPAQSFMAHIEINPNGSARVQSASKRFMDTSFLLDPLEVEKLGLQSGDLVEVQEQISRNRTSARFAPVRKAGNINTEYGISQIALEDYDLPSEFPDAVLREVNKLTALSWPAQKGSPLAGELPSETRLRGVTRATNSTPLSHPSGASSPARGEHDLRSNLKQREDWRHIPFCTIDPIDAKDHDDAVAARWDESPENKGGFILDVAIADVSAYLRHGTALDDHARLRGNSIYFPGRVVPMLPERLSNDLCSLRPNEDRPALCMRMVFDSHGHKKKHSIHRIIMRSHAKLAYEEAQRVFESPSQKGGGIEPHLHTLYTCYEILAKARDKRAPLELDLPERKIKLTPEGTVSEVIFPERLEAHKLIEECMIQANVAAAEYLEQHKTPLIYRAHDAPSAEKLMALKNVLKTMHITLPAGNDLRPTIFNRILGKVKGETYEHLVNELVLRSQAQAEYVAENYGHFGLNLHKYAHFTSPIRRYADVIVHRALIRAAKLGHDGLTDHEIEELAQIATHISATERKAVSAERDTSDRLIAHHLADRIGAIFSSRISGLTRSGLFVRLSDTGADGFIPRSAFGFGWQYDEKLNTWRGRKGTQRFEIGMPLEVRLVECAPMAGALRFALAEGGAPALGLRERKAKYNKAKRR